MLIFFRKKDIFLFVLFVATLHILSTFLVGSHVGKGAGTQAAGVVSGILQNQDASAKFAGKSRVYRNIFYFLSLPFGLVLQPIHQQWAVRPARENKIHISQYEFRANLLDTAAMVLNSIVFSLLVYWCFKTLIQRKNKRE